MQRRAFLFLIGMLALPALAKAAVTITVPNQGLLPNMSGQFIDIMIAATAGEGLNSMDFDLVINNLAAGAPPVTALNITSAPTLWAANATTLFPGIDPPSSTEIFQSVANNSAVDSPIGVSSVLARLTVDTTGFGAGGGPWSLELDNPGGAAPTVLQAVGGPVLPTIINGSMFIIPEPSSVVLGVFAAAGLALVAVRRRRARCAA